MKQLLPDTQLLVWLASDAREMPRRAEEELRNRDNSVFFSLASIWETSIKFALGRPDFLIDPRALRNGLLRFGFTELQITSEHAIAVSTLPHIHRDPFDRLLVAQAQWESLTLMTTDKTLLGYGPFVEWY